MRNALELIDLAEAGEIDPRAVWESVRTALYFMLILIENEDDSDSENSDAD